MSKPEDEFSLKDITESKSIDFVEKSLFQPGRSQFVDKWFKNFTTMGPSSYRYCTQQFLGVKSENSWWPCAGVWTGLFGFWAIALQVLSIIC